MLPADETAASGCSEPKDYKVVKPALQDRFTVHPWQFRIAIVDPRFDYAEALNTALRTNGFWVTSHLSLESLLEFLSREQVDLVVLVFGKRLRWKEELKSFCESLRNLENRPDIVCVLQWPPKGPEDRLYADSLNVGVLYEY